MIFTELAKAYKNNYGFNVLPLLAYISETKNIG